MPPQNTFSTAAPGGAFASDRNPFRSLQQRSATDNPTGNPPESQYEFYGATQVNEARGSIIQIQNHGNSPSEANAGGSQGAHLPTTSSRPYFSPLPGSDAAHGPVKTYTRLMMCQGHGHPLWNPRPPDDLPSAYLDGGVRIGDVGVVTLDGVFDYAFNIYLPADHPINLGRTPPDFERLVPHPSVRTERWKWVRKSRIVSPGVSGDLGPGAKHTFESAHWEGAALALPHGASREDARDIANLRDYAVRHAVGWYQYLITRRGWEVRNGSLYLITGCDKTSGWGTAAFSGNIGNSFRMVFSPEGREGEPTMPFWVESGYAETSSGATLVSDERNHCIFLRGFKATLQPRFWAELTYAVQITSISEVDRGFVTRLMSIVPPILWFLRRFGPEDTLTKSLLDAQDESTQPPLHPPEIVNLDLLQKVPHARLALTHDSVFRWPDVDPSNGSFPLPSEILSNVYEKYSIRKSGRVVGLVSKRLASSPPGGLLPWIGHLWSSSLLRKPTVEVVPTVDPPPNSESSHQSPQMGNNDASNPARRDRPEEAGPEPSQGVAHTDAETSISSSNPVPVSQASGSLPQGKTSLPTPPTTGQSKGSKSHPDATEQKSKTQSTTLARATPRDPDQRPSSVSTSSTTTTIRRSNSLSLTSQSTDPVGRTETSSTRVATSTESTTSSFRSYRASPSRSGYRDSRSDNDDTYSRAEHATTSRSHASPRAAIGRSLPPSYVDRSSAATASGRVGSDHASQSVGDTRYPHSSSPLLGDFYDPFQEAIFRSPYERANAVARSARDTRDTAAYQSQYYNVAQPAYNAPYQTGRAGSPYDYQYAGVQSPYENLYPGSPAPYPDYYNSYYTGRVGSPIGAGHGMAAHNPPLRSRSLYASSSQMGSIPLMSAYQSQGMTPAPLAVEAYGGYGGYGSSQSTMPSAQGSITAFGMPQARDSRAEDPDIPPGYDNTGNMDMSGGY